MAAPRARRPAKYGALRAPAPPPGMVVELLTPDPAPTDPAPVSLPAVVPEPVSVPEPVPEPVSVPVVVSVPEVVSDPFPEPVFPVPVPTLVFPPGATVTGAAAEPAM